MVVTSRLRLTDGGVLCIFNHRPLAIRKLLICGCHSRKLAVPVRTGTLLSKEDDIVEVDSFYNQSTQFQRTFSMSYKQRVKITISIRY